MAVLIEAISVVIRCESILNFYAGGIESFMLTVPNKTLCADGELACVNFMMPGDVRVYAEYLRSCGLKKEESNNAIDFVVVDQLNGLCSPCDWAEFGKTNWNNNPKYPISVCRMIPTKVNTVVAPNGWNYSKSVSANFKFFDTYSVPKNFKLVRTEKNLDVFYDENTGEEFYVRRL